jgi:hypothetical protein
VDAKPGAGKDALRAADLVQRLGGSARARARDAIRYHPPAGWRFAPPGDWLQRWPRYARTSRSIIDALECWFARAMTTACSVV